MQDIVTIGSIESQRDRVSHPTDGSLKHALSANQLEVAIHRQTGTRRRNLHTNALQIETLIAILKSWEWARGTDKNKFSTITIRQCIILNKSIPPQLKILMHFLAHYIRIHGPTFQQ